MYSLSLPLDPVPASRPRVTRWGVYYGKRYTEFRRRGTEILAALDWSPALLDLLPLRGRLAIHVVFNVVRPRTSKLHSPIGDLDNYLKTLDILNGVLWSDDKQIEITLACKRFAEVGSIEIGIESINDNDISGFCESRSLSQMWEQG
jgi:Holliday junction resolvase RusA-like endonuclease|tara:strand:+ start:229 stop:669 length:441 start_codon:yes stop_codon:yes gene_type:complete